MWVAAVPMLLVCCSGSTDKPADGPVAADGSYPAIHAGITVPEGLVLPEGFAISIFAEVDDARSLALSPEGTVYVGNKDGNRVYALRDTDGNKIADKKWVVATGLNMPNGVAFRNGDLYVAEVSRILRYSGIESSLAQPPKASVIYDKYPTDAWHGWKYIAFGPDGKLYVPVGAPCNVCDKGDAVYASITRMNADGSGMEVFARGIRNSVGFTWHPQDKAMWFTDNGRDMMGDDIPPCELNRAPSSGLHFGFPYCHGGKVSDPEFGKGKPCDQFTAPARALGAHVAPLGLKFYTGDQFPEQYRNNLFLAEHGSWNRSRKSGYRIVRARLEGSRVVSYDSFISGWLDDSSQKVSGRPVDILQMPDGSLLVSDDKRGVVYRISYNAK